MSSTVNTKSQFSLEQLFRQTSGYIHCLPKLLEALDWVGDLRHIAEKLPHFEQTLTCDDFLLAMKRLDYHFKRLPPHQGALHSELFPCLYVDKQGRPYVLFSLQGESVQAFDGTTNTDVTLSVHELAGEVYSFEYVKPLEEIKRAKKRGWFKELCYTHKSLVYQLLGVGVFLSIFTVFNTLFVMQVYDKVIGGGSLNLLAGLFVGMILVISTGYALKKVKAMVLATISAKVDMQVGSKILQRLLFLPVYYIENTTIGSQVSRIKGFDSVRDFFNGPLFSMFFEVPLVSIYIITVAALGGALALIPAFLVILYIALYFLLIPVAKRRIDAVSEASAAKQRFLIEGMEQLADIKSAAAEEIWLARYRDISATNSLANHRQGTFSAVLNAIADATVVVGVAGMLIWGVNLVIDGGMTTGGLIACMMLVWKILNPLKTVFTSLPRIEQIRQGIQQIDDLMILTPERDPNQKPIPLRNLRGEIEFEGVFYRYGSTSKAALQGFSLKIAPGQVVAVTGSNGSGKSTLLKLLLRLYPLQSGDLRIDDVDIRQYDAKELRHAIAYVPQDTELFFGTIMQNIRLSSLTATEEDIARAVRLADLEEDLKKLPDGLNTKVKDKNTAEFSSNLLRKIALARAYVKNAKILLMDEPGAGLDMQADAALVNAIHELKGETTIVFVTHRPSHMKAADQVIVLHEGEIVDGGEPDAVLEKLSEKYS